MMPGFYAMSLGHFCARIWKSQKGATAIEYGFIAVLISLGALAAFGAVGDSLNSVFSSLTSNIEDASPGGADRGNAPADAIG